MDPALFHDRSYFEDQYRSDPDPWGFDSRWYEQRKYDLTLAALPDARYRRALEPGCANGALTERLASRCDQLVACELIDHVAASARRRLCDWSNVHVETAAFPDWQPDGTGDLVVWSEVAYYLTPEGFEQAVDQLDCWLEPGGVLVAVHYTGNTNYPLGGNETHERIDDIDFLSHHSHLIDPMFRLDVWRRDRPLTLT